jgi:hypothetical protein
MPWTYFTTYLDGSRPIIEDERNELWTQLELKLTGCAARYTVYGGGKAQVIASHFRTDYTAILDSQSTGSVPGTLEEAIAGIEDLAFTNYATARADALTDEGITAGDLATIIASRWDSYHLWNYYKRLIENLTPRTAADLPTLTCRSRSASKSKCGFGTFVPSTPPKRYLTKSYSGAATVTLNVNTLDEEGNVIAYCQDQACYTSVTWSGAETYNRTTDCIGGGSDTFTVTASGDCGEVCPVENDFPCGWNGSPSDTETVRTHLPEGCAPGAIYNTEGSGSLVETLSDEFSTSMLSGDVDAAMAALAWSGWGGTCEAYLNISADELTITKREFQYKFTLPTLGAGLCYQITWVERFTPEGGGSPTDTARTYDWDGSATETPVYSVSAPAVDGTTSIESVAASCVCP